MIEILKLCEKLQSNNAKITLFSLLRCLSACPSGLSPRLCFSCFFTSRNSAKTHPPHSTNFSTSSPYFRSVLPDSSSTGSACSIIHFASFTPLFCSTLFSFSPSLPNYSFHHTPSFTSLHLHGLSDLSS